MNTIGKKFVSVTLALTTGVWLLGASFLPIASAQTSSDIQAQIAALNAQLAQLQSQLTSGSGSVAGAATFTFTRNLTVGSTGTDVQNLQIFLNSKGFVIANSGAGSPGHESTYFGGLTKAALAKFQAANGVSPAVGYFGAITRAKIASMGGVVVTPPGTTTPPGSSAVTLAADNPAAGTVTTAASQVSLARFMFSGNYTVTSVVLQRIGVSADTSLSNVYIFDHVTQARLTDAASVSSGSLINFNNPSGLFTVSGQREISVKADLAASSGETIGVQLVSFTVSGGSPATVNISGNLFTVASATLASVSIASSTITGSGDTNAANDIMVWQGNMTVSTRNVVFSRIAFRQMGSINNGTDIRNFRLYVDGTLISTVANLDSNGYVTFAGFSQTLQTGTRVLKVLADVIGGSGRTAQLSLRGSYDIAVTDTQYNLNPAVTISGGSFPAAPVQFNILNGYITVSKATNSPSSNVILNGSDVPLADYTFTAYGEPVKVQTLNVGAAILDGNLVGTTSTLRNGRILVNGTQYGSTATLGNNTQYTTNFIVYPGTPATVEIRADVFDNTSTNTLSSTSTVQVVLRQGSSNGSAQVSLSSSNVPTNDVAANQVTAQSGALTLVKTSSYGNQTTVVPQTAYKLADFSLTNGNIEGVNVNTLTLTYTASGTLTYAKLANVYIKYGSSQTTIKGTPSSSGDAFTVTFTVAPNTTIPIQVYGDMLSSGVTTGDAITLNLAISAVTASSGQSSPVSATPGQKITGVTAGTATAALDGSAPTSQLVDDSGAIISSVAKIQPVNDGVNLTGVTIGVNDPSGVGSMDLLYNGSVLRAGIPASTSIAVTGLNQLIPANTTGLVSVRLNMAGIGVGMGNTGENLTTTMSSFTGTSASTGGTSNPSGTVTGNAMYAYHAYPVISAGTNGVATSLAGGGTKTVADFTITPTGGSIGWRQISFNVATSSASTTIAAPGMTSTLFDRTAGSWITLCAATSSVVSSQSAFTLQACSEQSLSSAHEYQLNVTITNAAGFQTGNSLSFQIARPSGSFTTSVSSAGLTTNNTTTSLVWSDQSQSAHSFTTADWTTDYLVSGLPTNTWVLSN